MIEKRSRSAEEVPDWFLQTQAKMLFAEELHKHSVITDEEHKPWQTEYPRIEPPIAECEKRYCKY